MKDLRHFTENNNSSSNPVIDRNTTNVFIRDVFLYMFGALAVSGVTAWLFASNADLFSLMYSQKGLTIFGYVIIFAPLGLALWMQAGFNKMTIQTLLLLFFVYSVLIGASLCSILHIYTTNSIASTFLITSITYGAMAFIGYTTKVDLTKFGSIMYMLFIGLFVAFLINFFLQSEMFDYIISFIGIIVFTGLTAFKMQEYKNLSQNPELNGVSRKKMSIIGGLQMYILFVNLFLMLLRFFGDRD